ncbi:MAG: putative Ig domain-containing protein [Ignavibacteriota bacterium]
MATSSDRRPCREERHLIPGSATTQLPPGLGLDPSGALTGTPTITGLNTFTIQVTDATGATGSKRFALFVGTLPVVITQIAAPPASTVGFPYPPAGSNQGPYFRASRGTGSGYTWTLGGLPAGLAPNPATGVQSGIAGTPAASGTFAASATATDSASETGSLNFNLTINPAPSISANPLQACTAGTSCSRTLSGSGGTAPLAWSLSTGALPAGMSLSAAGVISGTPAAVAFPTTATFTVALTDSVTASTTQQFSLVVNPAIVITPATLPATTSGIAYPQTLTATGGTGSIAFSATGLPAWLTLSAGGLLSGTAPSVATQTTFSFSAKATDSDGASATNPYSVVVNPLPTITNASPLPAWTINRPYAQTILASGGTGALTFADNGSTLPAWLTITSGGVLSGTPTATGTVSFTLQVTDSLSSFSTKTFSLTINPTPSVTTSTLPDTTSGIAYSQTLAAGGGTTPLTWQSAGLPSWLTLSTAGVLTGTAPVETSATPFNFSVTVSDAAGAVSGSQSLTVTVNPGVQITTPSPLPSTGSGLSYSQTFASSGGTGAVTWSSGNLPAWLTLSSAGILSGTAPVVATPTAYNFNVTATDSVRATGSKQFSVTVNPQLTITTSSPLPTWTINRSYAQTIAAAGGTGTLTFADNGTTLPAWLTITTGGVLSGTPDRGRYGELLRCALPTVSRFPLRRTFALTINPTPSVTTTTLPATTSGIAYSQTLALSGGTTPFTWQATGLPSWLSLSQAGVLSGTAPAETSSTPFNFSVVVSDAAGAVSAGAELLRNGESGPPDHHGQPPCPTPDRASAIRRRWPRRAGLVRTRGRPGICRRGSRCLLPARSPGRRLRSPPPPPITSM